MKRRFVLCMTLILILSYAASAGTVGSRATGARGGRLYLPHVSRIEPSTTPTATSTATPTVTPSPTPTLDPNQVVWDPRLTARGAVIVPAVVTPGAGYWRLLMGVWYAEGEWPMDGKHHIFVEVLDGMGARQPGVPLRITSLDESKLFETIRTEAKPGDQYAANFPMWELAPAYRIKPADGHPADAVSNLGLGDIERPRMKIHTSYGFVWRWVTAAEGSR